MSGRPIDLLDHGGRADRHGRLVDHDGARLEVGRDLLGRRLDVGEVGRAVGALGRRHAEEDELGPDDRLDGRVGEATGVPAATPSGHQLVEADLDDRHAPGAQGGQPASVALGQDDRVAEVGQRGRRGQPDVAGADHGDRVRRAAASRALVRVVMRPPPVAGQQPATRRARPSCQSGRAGSPLRRSAMLSSTELAGRGAGRGGSSSAVRDRLHPLGVGARLGEDRPHEAPPGRGAAVGHVEDARAGRSRPRVTTAGARSAVKVGDPCWSSTKRSSPVAVGQAQRGRHHVGAVGAAQPAGAHDGRPGPALALARQLGRAVDRRRARRVPLPVGPVARCRRRRSRWRRRPRARPTSAAASATLRVPTALTAKAGSTSVSHRSTAVKAPPWRTSSGRKSVKVCSDRVAVVDPHGVDVGGEHLVVEPGARPLGPEQRAAAPAGGHPSRQGVAQVAAELPVRPGDRGSAPLSRLRCPRPLRRRGPGPAAAPTSRGGRRTTPRCRPGPAPTRSRAPSRARVRSLEESST